MGYELDEAIELIAQLPDSEVDYARVFNLELLRIKGDNSEAYNLCTNILDDTKDPCVRFIALVMQIAHTIFLGNFKEAQKCSKNAEDTYKSMNQDQKYKIKKWYPLYFNWRGNIATFSSDLEDTFKNYFKAIELYKELEPPTRITNTYINIAATYTNMGRLDESYQILQQIQDKLPTKSLGAFFLPANFGLYYRVIGDDKNGIKYFEEALVGANNLHNDNLKYRANHMLTVYHVDLGNRQLAKKHLDECSRLLSTMVFNKILGEKHQNYLMAYYLKSSSRAKHKVQAQELLEPIVYEDVIDINLTIMATTALLEILLDELRNYGEEEVLNEILSLVDRLEESVKQQKSITVKLSTIIFRSKLALVEGDVNHAMDLLKKAEEIATSSKVIYFLERINTERKSLENDIVKWQELINSGASIKERLEKTNYREYLEEAQNFARSFT
ncbi:MAG: hypothetical protein HeimC2_11510 [Candidatus Heimdallarchaeota archaeon LC_2]|nr:MAG: hypothetical protein HeimC2_11510 [Candidatus Heimdallarchaeota archaeon LC_2]